MWGLKVLSCSVVSNSLQPHGLYNPPDSCLWNSPGQNIGVGLPFPPPGNVPSPGIQLRSPALQADSLPSEPPSNPIQGLERLNKFSGTCDQGVLGSRLKFWPWGIWACGSCSNLHLLVSAVWGHSCHFFMCFKCKPFQQINREPGLLGAYSRLGAF